MPVFIYKVKTPTGDVNQGEIEATNLRAATKQLMDQGLQVTNIREKSTGQGLGCVWLVVAGLACLLH
ncbi:MAG TPA: hypothetical protein VGO93_15710 [Candidatus Xenobia bacterium]